MNCFVKLKNERFDSAVHGRLMFSGDKLQHRDIICEGDNWNIMKITQSCRHQVHCVSSFTVRASRSSRLSFRETKKSSLWTRF